MLYPRLPALLLILTSRKVSSALLLLTLVCTCGHAQNNEDLYDLQNVVDIKLEMHESHWKRKLTSYKRDNLSKRIVATLWVNGEKFDSVGVRLKGNSSYFAPIKEDKKKLPFNIKVSYAKKDQQVAGKYKTLKLSNVYRDPSYLREALSYVIARDYMAAPHCNFARLTVDDDYYGVYNLTESIDEHFWADRFGHEDGILFKCDPESKDPPPNHCPAAEGANLKHLGPDSICYEAAYELKKSNHGWAELMDLTAAVTESEADLNTVLNADEALWMLAYNNALANLDSYLGAFCHNYYLYKDPGGVWHPVVWDLNLSMGGFRFLEPNKSLNNAELISLSPFVHFMDKNPSRPLLLRLLGTPRYRKMYVAHLKTILDEQFTSGRYETVAEEIRSTITPLVIQEPNPLYPTELYTQNYAGTVKIKGSEVLGILEFFQKRGDYLRKHPLFAKPVPTIIDHAAEITDGTTTVRVTLAAEVPSPAVWLAHRPAGAGTFQYAKMQGGATTYTVELPNETIDEYFIVAEGAISAAVLPARSAREWFTVGSLGR